MATQEEIETIEINGKKFVALDSLQDKAESVDGMKYCIIRTQSAGVFAGYVQSRTGQEVVIRRARRLWYWSGAASLSQLAVDGTNKPGECKFPAEVDRIEVMQAIEILDVTKKAQDSIASVKVWQL